MFQNLKIFIVMSESEKGKKINHCYNHMQIEEK